MSRSRSLDDWSIEALFGKLVLGGWDRYRKAPVADTFLYQTGFLLSGAKLQGAQRSWKVVIVTTSGRRYRLMRPGRGWVI